MKGGAGGACLILHGGLLIVVFLYMVPVSIYLIRHKYGHHHACINLIAFGAVILAIFVKKFSTTTAVRATTESYWTSPFGISHGTIGWSLFSALFSQLIIGKNMVLYPFIVGLCNCHIVCDCFINWMLSGNGAWLSPTDT